MDDDIDKGPLRTEGIDEPEATDELEQGEEGTGEGEQRPPEPSAITQGAPPVAEATTPPAAPPAPEPPVAAPPVASPPQATELAAEGTWHCMKQTCQRDFQGVTQRNVSEPIVCPHCGGDTVIYAGDKEETA